MNWESKIDIYTRPYVKQTASGKLLLYSSGGSGLCSVMAQRLDGGGREAQDGGGICIFIADSLCYMAEMNTTL